MATERQVLATVDEIVKSVERAADLPDDSEPVSTLLGRFGEDASAGRTEEWRMAHPSSSSGGAGPRRNWAKGLTCRLVMRTMGPNSKSGQRR